MADWWAAHQTAGDAGDSGVMIAARVADVEDLNRHARAHLAAAGALRGPALPAGQRDFRRGDRVVCLRNDRRLGVKNGTRGTVTAGDVARGSLALAVDGGVAVTVGGDYLQDGHLAHGYALTGHKPQGLTCQQIWVLGSDQLYREWGYTALSRHREAARLYFVGDVEPEADQHPHTLAQPDSDPIAELTRALQRSRGQRLAIDHADPDELAGRAAADVGAQQAQPAAAAGQQTEPWPGPHPQPKARSRDGARGRPPGQAYRNEHGAPSVRDASLDTAIRRSVQAAEFDPPLYLHHAPGRAPTTLSSGAAGAPTWQRSSATGRCTASAIPSRRSESAPAAGRNGSLTTSSPRLSAPCGQRSTTSSWQPPLSRTHRAGRASSSRPPPS